MPSQAVEDYLKTIYRIRQEHGKVTMKRLAEALSVAPASATGMIKKLAARGLVLHERYRGVELTESGRHIALEVVRHHRLIELFLSKTLDVPWDLVHQEAEKLEHAISEELEDRMAEALGQPQFDPHGSPIPQRDGTVTRRPQTALLDLEPGRAGPVLQVSDHDAEMLRYLTQIGIALGTEVEVLSIAPFDGPVTIRVVGESHAISRLVAQHVYVAPPE